MVLKGAVRVVTRMLRANLNSRRRRIALKGLEQRWESLSSDFQCTQIVGRDRNVWDRVSIRVINLEKRPDRLQSITEQLLRLGVPSWDRIVGANGLELCPEHSSVVAGSIGCEVSHIAAISEGIASEIEAVMVCEDDLEFVGSSNQLESAVEEFLQDPRLDVLSLSGRPRGGSIAVSDNLRIVIGLVGRGCYLIKPHMVVPLVEIFGDGLRKLKHGKLEGKGDLEWRKAQSTRFFFAFPRQDLAQQSEGFSDIESKYLGPR